MNVRLFALVALSLSVSAVAQQVPAPHFVFFDWGKNELSRDAMAELDKVAANYAAKGGQVVLAAYSDRSGDARVNLVMSRRRGELVRDYLAGKGVPAGAVRVQAYGEANEFVPTADGVREVQNRRVDIWIVN
nr:OmpA family protein [uncultured Sphingomonas sp.]